MRKANLCISILEQIPLNATELLLFKVNLELLKFKHKCIREVAKEGIENLLNHVHYRLSITNLFKDSSVWFI